MSKTKLVVMTAEDFRKHAEAEVSALEKAFDQDRYDALSKSYEAAKSTEDGKEIPVLVVEEPSMDDRLNALAAAKAQADDKPKDEPAAADPAVEAADPAKKAEPKVAAQLAIEAMDSLIGKYQELKAKIEAGTLTRLEADTMFQNEWQIKDVIASGAAICAKAETFKALVDEIHPALEKIEKADGDEADGDDDQPEAGTEDADEADKGAKAAPVACPKCKTLLNGATECPKCDWKLEDEKSKQDDVDAADEGDQDAETPAAKTAWPDDFGGTFSGAEAFKIAKYADQPEERTAEASNDHTE